jgi:dicarboxylate transporter 10
MSDSKLRQRPEPGYLGGLASMTGTLATHPLDTIKVLLQTQRHKQFGFLGMTVNIVRTNGIYSLYNGLSAALLMSGTYSTVRFASYEILKEYILNRERAKWSDSKTDVTLQNHALSFYQKILIAGMSGALGAAVGTPADICNIRMQNDCRLPPDKRRNYKNCFEALNRIIKTEGASSLYIGFNVAIARAVLTTIGQLAFYDEFKERLLKTQHFTDNIFTHFTASMGAGLIATLITMPTDVIKTLLMSAKPGELKGIIHAATLLLKIDKLGLFKGFWPRYIRLGPFTVITLVIYEKLKLLNNYLTSLEKT